VNDLEHVLGSRLHDLADEMTGPHPAVPAADAIARHRRQRRARMGTAAVAVVVALVAAGVPTGVSLLGAGTSGGGTTAGTPTPAAPTSTPDAGTPTGAPAAESAAESAAREAAAHAELQLLMLARLPQPLRLTAPAAWGTCPEVASVLSRQLGTPWVYWQGHLPGGPRGCEYVDAAGAAGTSTPETRQSVGIGFLTGTTVAQMQAGVASGDADPALDCASSPVSGDAILQRCVVAGELRYALTVADTGGTGIWVLSVSTGDRYSGDPGTALQAVTRAAEAVFRH
jgi:hypothetical protein